MRILKTVMWTSMGVAAFGVAGCDVFLGGRSRQERVYVEQQPVYVEQQPQYVVVQQAPPPIIVESRPPPPSVTHVWINGSWNWDSQRYSWQAGRYVVPPQPDVVWVAASYDSGAHRYTPGGWSKPGNGRGRGRGGN